MPVYVGSCAGTNQWHLAVGFSDSERVAHRRRRYADIIFIQLGFYYQALRAADIRGPTRNLYYMSCSVGVLCFVNAMIFYKKPADGRWRRFLKEDARSRRSLQVSTFFHFCVHVMGNVSNTILYTSDIPEIGEAWFVKRLVHLLS